MAFPIRPRYRSGSAGNPTSLELAELAVNTHDGSVYLGADVGVVQIGIPVAAGTEETTWTANGSASQFAPIAGYNGTAVGGYLVTVQGIQQPFTVTADNGGTLVFDFTPTAGSVIRARAITQAMGGGGGSGVPATDVQVFTADGTWTKPDGAKSVNVVCVGGGQGGGGGDNYGAGGSANGGKGGDGGRYTERTIFADNLGPTVAVSVGTGGSGGAGGINTEEDFTLTYGTSGTNGEDSSFGNFVKSSGGGNGALGQFESLGGVGGVGDADGVSATSAFASGGGGGGSGYTGSSMHLGGSGAVSALGNGGNGGSTPSGLTPGNGNGEAGENYGGGGGGGGAGINGYPQTENLFAGDGGNGAPGVVIVTTYF